MNARSSITAWLAPLALLAIGLCMALGADGATWRLVLGVAVIVCGVVASGCTAALALHHRRSADD